MCPLKLLLIGHQLKAPCKIKVESMSGWNAPFLFPLQVKRTPRIWPFCTRIVPQPTWKTATAGSVWKTATCECLSVASRYYSFILRSALLLKESEDRRTRAPRFSLNAVLDLKACKLFPRFLPGLWSCPRSTSSLCCAVLPPTKLWSVTGWRTWTTRPLCRSTAT